MPFYIYDGHAGRRLEMQHKVVDVRVGLHALDGLAKLGLGV